MIYMLVQSSLSSLSQPASNLGNLFACLPTGYQPACLPAAHLPCSAVSLRPCFPCYPVPLVPYILYLLICLQYTARTPIHKRVNDRSICHCSPDCNCFHA